MKRYGQNIYLVSIFFICTFLLNFFWESWHAVYLYRFDEGVYLPAIHTFQQFVHLITYVSSIDATVLTGIILIGSIMWKDSSWFLALNEKKIFYLFVTTVGSALLIEYKGVYLFHQWTYSSLMPTVWGIGISPLFQLFVAGLIACGGMAIIVDTSTKFLRTTSSK